MPLRQADIRTEAAGSQVQLLSAAVGTNRAQRSDSACEMAYGIMAKRNGCKNKICIILWSYYIYFPLETFVQLNYYANS